MKASRRITQQNIRISRLGCRHRIVDDRRRVCALLSACLLYTSIKALFAIFFHIIDIINSLKFENHHIFKELDACNLKF